MNSSISKLLRTVPDMGDIPMEVRKAIGDVAFSLQLSGAHPQADRWFILRSHEDYFRECVDLFLIHRAGRSLVSYGISSEAFRYAIATIVKAGHKNLGRLEPPIKPIKKGFFVESDCEVYPGSSRDAGVVYFYSGKIAYLLRRVIKIGFTGKVLEKYLGSLKRTHDPQLLGFVIGDMKDERDFQAKWIPLSGREWFKPTEAMFRWMENISGFEKAGGFKEIEEITLAEWEDDMGMLESLVG